MHYLALFRTDVNKHLNGGGANHFSELGISSFHEMPNQKTEYGNTFKINGRGELLMDTSTNSII